MAWKKILAFGMSAKPRALDLFDGFLVTMNKLPINSKIRTRLDKTPLIEATERQIKEAVWMRSPRQSLLFLQDGLINTMMFPGYYGAFFVLNYERHMAGLLDEEQLDRFVDILLDKLETPYLKAVHPQADIEGLFAGLLHDRRCNSRECHLVDRINRYGRLPSWRRARRGGDPRTAIMDLVLRDAPFAIALGHSPAAVLEQLQQELGKAVADIDVHPALKQSLFDRYLDHFMIGYPELWPAVGLDAAWFLGERMIKNYGGGGGYSADKAVVNGSAGKPVISKGGETYAQGMADLILDYLEAIDPKVLDAEHLLLDGSRSQAWLDRCPNLESRLDILERLIHYGISHPALKRIEGLAGKLSTEGQQSVILEYLRYGSKVTEQLTRAIIEIRPEMHQWAFEQRYGYVAVQRLAQIRGLTSEQVGSLSAKIKRKLLEGDFGV